MADTLRLWTSQHPRVLDTLQNTGVYHVKWDYVTQKYQESAWSFHSAYTFLARAALDRGICPPGAESAIWLYRDPRWICLDQSCPLLCFDIPAERVLTFDLRLWNRVLNLAYLGEDLQDELRFQKELERLGLSSTLPLFQTSFFPLQKRKVQQSWNRIFTTRTDDELYLQAAVWELRREWMVSISKLDTLQN